MAEHLPMEGEALGLIHSNVMKRRKEESKLTNSFCEIIIHLIKNPLACNI